MKLFIEIFVAIGIVAWLTALTVFFYFNKTETDNKFKVVAGKLYLDISEKKFNESNGFPPDEIMDAEAYRYILYHYRSMK